MSIFGWLTLKEAERSTQETPAQAHGSGRHGTASEAAEDQSGVK
jgi:hypothetical protein